MKKFSIILACSYNGGIGYQNKIPWYFPEDLINFKNITTNVNNKDKKNAIVMGSKTWESLPIKPLPNRLNIVLSSNPEYEINDKSVIVANSFEELFIYTSTDTIENIFIIGGSRLYNKFLEEYKERIDKIYLTIIMDKIYECDRFINLNNILLEYDIYENDVQMNKDYIYLIANNRSS